MLSGVVQKSATSWEMIQCHKCYCHGYSLWSVTGAPCSWPLVVRLAQVMPLYKADGRSLWRSWPRISPFPLLIRPWRSCAPGRFLLPLPIDLKVPRCQADFFPPSQPWRSQERGQPGCDDPVTEQRLSEWLVFFYLSLSWDYDCYIDTASQVLRFDPDCRGSRWLGTIN